MSRCYHYCSDFGALAVVAVAAAAEVAAVGVQETVSLSKVLAVTGSACLASKQTLVCYCR